MPYKNIEDRRKNDAKPERKQKQKESAKKHYAANKDKINARIKQWVKDNPEKYKERLKKWTYHNSDKRRNIVLKNEYGITLDDYNRMFEDQKGRCAICDKHQSELKRKLHVDHCHTCNEVRGLLCQHCNTVLGLIKDDVQALQRAIKYLTSFYL